MQVDPDVRRQRRGQAVLVAVGCNERDIGVFRVDGVVDLSESFRVGGAAMGEVVFVANLDVFDLPGFLAAVLCANTAPGGVGRAEEVLCAGSEHQ